jgi:hypothetical protein
VGFIAVLSIVAKWKVLAAVRDWSVVFQLSVSNRFLKNV